MAGSLQPGPARADTARGRPNVAVKNRVTGAGDQGRRGGTPQNRGTKPAVGVAKRPPGGQGHADGTEKSQPTGENQRLSEALARFCVYLRDANQPGHLALAEFSRAPATTQSAFWNEVRKRTAAERETVRVEEGEAADLGITLSDFYARFFITPEGLVRRGQRRIWGQRWRDRAYRDRAMEQRGHRVDDGFDAEKAHLEGIEAVDYVFRLTGAEPNRAGYVHCPLPGHDERTPSFSCRETRWRCYGCGAYGSIYELAGLLWGLPRFGRDFRAIHERLVEVFG